jgi:hypothetical protein
MEICGHFRKTITWEHTIGQGKQLPLPFSSEIDRIFTMNASWIGLITSELDLWYFKVLPDGNHESTKIDCKDISLDVLCPPRHQKRVLSGASMI